MQEKPIKILIIGAGFGGVSCALDLSERHLRNVEITLINPTPHFEYHGALYRVLIGRSPLEVCIPLGEIFRNKRQVVFEQDFITDIDLNIKKAIGKSGSTYRYDYLVLALGSETNYYDIDGLRDYAFSVKSITDVLRLKEHLHEVFSSHVVIVGGGPNGCEIAGSLVQYMEQLTEKHGTDAPLLSVDLISSSKRLLPHFPEELSGQVEVRLRELGVKVYLERKVTKEELNEVYLNDMKIATHTVIWTAGTKAPDLFRQLGLNVNNKGQVLVNDFFQPKQAVSNKQYLQNVYIIGDSADVCDSGFASPAIDHGHCAAENIARSIYNSKLVDYIPETGISVIPVGKNWVAVSFAGFNFSGRIGWWIRRILDLKIYLSILPFSKALVAWKEGGILWENCPTCTGDIFSHRSFLNGSKKRSASSSQ